MTHSKKFWTSAIMALALCFVTAFGAAAQVADVDINASSVMWHPNTGEKTILTISGPGGDFRHEFAAGEKAAFEAFDKSGALLQDGTYSWRMVSVPVVSDELKAARAAGEKMVAPEALVQSGHFTVAGGFFVQPSQEIAAPKAPGGEKDQVFLDDLIVEGSACIGLDCSNGESFGFDTLRLKENNLRIKFQDTSASASFPGNDWQLTANESDNGGANKFSIEDIDGGKTPFTILAGAPSNSLYVNASGNIGVGTSTPVVETHIVDGDSPTLRLEQDGSSGFTPQTWDLAGNETNFFVRDVTHSSKLPFKIIPNAPTNALYVAASGNIGLGDASPDASLNIERTDGTAQIYVEEKTTTTGTYTLLNMETTGTNVRPRMTMTHGALGTAWNFDILNTSGNFNVTRGGGGPIYTFDATSGNLTIDGVFISNGTTLDVPDYVFADDYELRSLEEVKTFIDAKSHLPDVPSAAEVNAGGLNITEMQLTLLRKIEELTLYTLEQHETIQELQTRLDGIEGGEQQ